MIQKRSFPERQKPRPRIPSTQFPLQIFLLIFFSSKMLRATVRGEKRSESQLGFLNDYSLFCQTLWGSKKAKCSRFCQKIFEYPFAPLQYFFYPFLICGALKKGHFPTSEVKNDDNSKYFEKNCPRFFVQCIYGRCGFSKEISNKKFEPTNGNFDSKSNNFLGKFKFSKSLKSTNFDPRWKKIFFLKNPTTILTSTNLS